VTSLTQMAEETTGDQLYPMTFQTAEDEYFKIRVRCATNPTE